MNTSKKPPRIGHLDFGDSHFLTGSEVSIVKIHKNTGGLTVAMREDRKVYKIGDKIYIKMAESIEKQR